MARIGTLLSPILLWFVCHSGHPAALDQSDAIHFPTSGSDAAQEHFRAGVAYLHSFGWKQARIEFLHAQELDPEFALAYWGESLTYNHPLFPERDATEPARALLKLGTTTEERHAKAPSPLEKGFLTAAEAYTFTAAGLPERRQAYRIAMESLFRKFPEHEEVQAFYILSLLAEAASSDPTRRLELRQKAASLAVSLFKQNDRHPGAVHYLIHSYDDPQFASLALNAADRYAQIAPVVPHARHMPSHIYIQLGRWYEVAALNETAFYTARALWHPGDDPYDQVHALDYGQYGDLQLADYDAATQWIERAEDTVTQNPDSESARQLLGRLRARLIIESRRWQYLPITEDLTSEEIFAAGLSAVNMRDMALAREANLHLKELANQTDSDLPIRIAQLELEASILFAANTVERALNTADDAVRLSLDFPGSDPLPVSLKPAMELKAELLLRAGFTDQAIKAFREALVLTPYRPWSILGLARSYATAGQFQQASAYYRQLLNIWSDASLLGVSEARTHLAIYH